MTFSILARDPETGAMGGAAATGSLCVGGWVLRGDIASGMSASQGAAPSTFWGADVLDAMRFGETAAEAVSDVTRADKGRAFRQLSALDPAGHGAAFTGERNTPDMGARVFPGGVVAGNMLTSESVLEHMRDSFEQAEGTFPERLLAALHAAQSAGGDSRGLLSAALLVLRRDRAPLTLRIDYSETPLDDLVSLHRRTTSGDYYDWSLQVPTVDAPNRVLD